jgi:hypothetical protein
MAWNEVDQILTRTPCNPELRRRWSACWQAAKASSLGAPGVVPWMLLSDRVLCFRSCDSVVQENCTETYENKQTLADEEYNRAARELNEFLEVL